jgi:hypothetical protein
MEILIMHLEQRVTIRSAALHTRPAGYVGVLRDTPLHGEKIAHKRRRPHRRRPSTTVWYDGHSMRHPSGVQQFEISSGWLDPQFRSMPQEDH